MQCLTSSPLRGPADEAWEAAARPGPNWTEARGASPPTFPSLRVVGRMGPARVCLEGRPPVWPAGPSQTMSPPSAAGGEHVGVSSKGPPFPLGSHKGTLAPTNLQWRATLRESVDLPQPKCLPCLRSFKFFESLMQTLKPLAAGQGMCLPFALSNPLAPYSHPIQCSDPYWLPLLNSGSEVQILGR